jgi:hypothetical protein
MPDFFRFFFRAPGQTVRFLGCSSLWSGRASSGKMEVHEYTQQITHENLVEELRNLLAVSSEANTQPLLDNDEISALCTGMSCSTKLKNRFFSPTGQGGWRSETSLAAYAEYSRQASPRT